MRISFLPIFFLLAAFSCNVFLTPTIHTIREKYLEERISHFGQLPSAGLQSIVLEFKGIAADYLLLRLTTFIGYKIKIQEKIEDTELQMVLLGLEKITDLDPHFWDPYVFAEGVFVWDVGKIEEVEPLLLKAAQHRVEDYRPYYYLGFNRFYFRKDMSKAAEYLREASRKPTCPDYLKNLAARLSLYGNETALGILFLQDLLNETQGGETRKYLAKRLDALQAIHTLEKAVLEYYKTLNKKPASVDDLIKEGIISTIPTDPYGGEWLIMKNGRVYTTSKLIAGTE